MLSSENGGRFRPSFGLFCPAETAASHSDREGVLNSSTSYDRWPGAKTIQYTRSRCSWRVSACFCPIRLCCELSSYQGCQSNRSFQIRSLDLSSSCPFEMMISKQQAHALIFAEPLGSDPLGSDPGGFHVRGKRNERAGLHSRDFQCILNHGIRLVLHD